MVNPSQFSLPIIAAGICLPSVATPAGKAQTSFGAVFQHSGVGFWEIDLAQHAGLDYSRLLIEVSIGSVNGPGVAGFNYGTALSGTLYAISTFRSDTNAQADVEIHVVFKLMPLNR